MDTVYPSGNATNEEIKSPVLFQTKPDRLWNRAREGSEGSDANPERAMARIY
jgi:hypothetical protein